MIDPFPRVFSHRMCTPQFASLIYANAVCATCTCTCNLLFCEGLGWEGTLWKKLKETGNGHKITGILNPASGPNIDVFPNDYANYQYILHDFLCKGTRATGEPAEAEALTAPAEEATEDATESPTGAPTGAPTDDNPTDSSPAGGNPQRALQVQEDCPADLTVRKYLAV